MADDSWFYTCLVNHDNFIDLRKLAANMCVIVSDIDKMRGVDYRSADGSGIDLLVATDFPHARAYQHSCLYAYIHTYTCIHTCMYP